MSAYIRSVNVETVGNPILYYIDVGEDTFDVLKDECSGYLYTRHRHYHFIDASKNFRKPEKILEYLRLEMKTYYEAMLDAIKENEATELEN